MNRPSLPRLGSTKLSMRVGAVVVVSAAAVAGIGAAPAQSTPQNPCPAPATVAAGDAVHGLTVSSGNTADPFGGTVLGTLTDGIAPGIDMVMVRLSSPEITRVGGIWEGMSGSPVYDAAGNLVGAVAYGLSAGPSPVAGVTPAADMENLLSEDGSTTALPRFRSHVTLGRTMQQRLIASGAATRTEASAGLSQLKLPFSISGISSGRRAAQVGRLLKLPNVRTVPAGGAATPNPGDPAGIFPGSNLAASLSYGDVTAAGVGTTTAVCGNRVLAFGHPFTFSGPTTMTLHTADAIYVQEDPTLAPFKVANLTGEVGAITGDHMAGIDGVLGTDQAPTPWDVTSTVALANSTRQRTGTTHITVQDYFSDLATTHLLADQDRVLDGYGKGDSTLTWDITGTRQDGTPFTLHRSDKYADSQDISFNTGMALYDVLSTLQYNRAENITLTGVRTDSTISRDYTHYSMRRLQRFAKGAWRHVNLDGTLRARAGRDIMLRVMLVSADHTETWRRVDVRMPLRSVHRFGYLEVFGGDTGQGSGGSSFFVSRSAGSSPFDQLLARLSNRPKNTEIVSRVAIQNDNGRTIAQRETRREAGDVVDGDFMVSVVGTR